MKGLTLRYLLVLTLACLGCVPVWAGAPVPAAYHGQLRDWYLHYLGRPIEPQALDYWGRKIVREGDPRVVQADILGSGEYYARNGSTPMGFIRALYRDIDGQEPLPGQVVLWLDRLQLVQRRDHLAEMFLGVRPPPRVPTRVDRVAGIIIGGIIEALVEGFLREETDSCDHPMLFASPKYQPRVAPPPPPARPQVPVQIPQRAGELLHPWKGR